MSISGSLKGLYISRTYQRLLQVSPSDGKTILNGTGSIETLSVSGSLTAYTFNGNLVGSSSIDNNNSIAYSIALG